MTAAGAGFFRPGEPVELVGGALIVSEPQGSPHAVAVGLVAQALRVAFGSGWTVREDKPVALDDESEPEPGVAVVRGSPRDYRDAHPARAGLADYWIVDLTRRALEVCRDPAPDPEAPFGWRYASIAVLDAAATVTPLASPAARVPSADLLP